MKVWKLWKLSHETWKENFQLWKLKKHSLLNNTWITLILCQGKSFKKLLYWSSFLKASKAQKTCSVMSKKTCKRSEQKIWVSWHFRCAWNTFIRIILTYTPFVMKILRNGDVLNLRKASKVMFLEHSKDEKALKLRNLQQKVALKAPNIKNLTKFNLKNQPP